MREALLNAKRAEEHGVNYVGCGRAGACGSGFFCCSTPQEKRHHGGPSDAGAALRAFAGPPCASRSDVLRALPQFSRGCWRENGLSARSTSEREARRGTRSELRGLRTGRRTRQWLLLLFNSPREAASRRSVGRRRPFFAPSQVLRVLRVQTCFARSRCSHRGPENPVTDSSIPEGPNTNTLVPRITGVPSALAAVKSASTIP